MVNLNALKEVKEFFETSNYDNAVEIMNDLLYRSHRDTSDFEEDLFGMHIYFDFPAYDMEHLEKVCYWAEVKSPDEEYDDSIYKCSHGQFKMRQILVACTIEYFLEDIRLSTEENTGFHQFYFQPLRKVVIPKKEAIEAIQSIIEGLERGEIKPQSETEFDPDEE